MTDSPRAREAGEGDDGGRVVHDRVDPRELLGQLQQRAEHDRAAQGRRAQRRLAMGEYVIKWQS